MITIRSTGTFSRTEAMLKKMQNMNVLSILHAVGQRGVVALYQATPKRTGETAISWSYKIEKRRKGWVVYWINTNVESGGTQIAVILQYGHGTGTGGYVQGIDYINPALKPIFDQVVEDIWREVTK